MSNDFERTYPIRDAADRIFPRPDFAAVADRARVLDTSKHRNEFELAPWLRNNPNAPPGLINRAMNDRVDDTWQPLNYALALNDAGLPVDMRLYAKGGHTLGLRPTAEPLAKEWPGQVEQWLRNIAMRQAAAARVPVLRRNRAPFSALP